VRDANGCVATWSFTVRAVPPLDLQVVSTTPILCAGGVGGFTVQASGGTDPYTYMLIRSGITNTILRPRVS
jgi:hypothetical protein